MRIREMNALVVEDETLMNWSLASSLTKWGFDVRRVVTGKDALDEIEKTGFDVILLDYRLPDLDGLSLARRLRNKQPGAAIFLLSAFQLSELQVDAGLIDSYFNKPLDMRQLHQALEELPRTPGDA